MARRLARNGADVVLVDVNADLLTKAKAVPQPIPNASRAGAICSAKPMFAHQEFEAYVTTLPTDCHGVKVHVSAIDVTNEEQVAGLFAGLSRVGTYFNCTSIAGKPSGSAQLGCALADIVVNCAGVTGKTNIKTHEVSLDNFNFVFNVNVNGTFLMCKSESFASYDGISDTI